jgi:lipopolysaccharide export system permease protein
MKVYTRYLLRAHIGPFLFAFLTLTGVILVNTLARQMAELAGRGLELGIILEFFVLSLPANIALTFPMSVLVAVLYTFSQLGTENELTALKASGVDLRRVVVPVLLAGMGITATMVWFNDRVLPEANHRWKVLMLDIARTSPLLTLREQTVNVIPTEAGRRYYLQAGRIQPTTNRLQDVVIYDLTESRLGRTIYADSGYMRFNEARTDLLLTLFDGHVREVDLDQPAQFQRLDFGQQLIRMQGVASELERQAGGSFRGDREMTIGMLRDRIETLEGDLEAIRERAGALARADVRVALGGDPEDRLRAPPSSGQLERIERMEMEEMEAADGVEEAAHAPAASSARLHSLDDIPDAGRDVRTTRRELDSSAQRAAATERQIRELSVEVHKKYSIAAAALIFVLVGAPLAVRFPAGGVGMVIAASLFIFSLYYVGLIGGETLADEGHVHPWIAMWAMNVLFAALGAWGLLKMGRESYTGRGGEGPAWLVPLRRIDALLRRNRGRGS